MANRPVIEVAVNDTAFQKFIELFNSYNDKLGDQPAAWNALNEAMGGAGAALTEGASSGRAALALAAEQAERVRGGLHGAVLEQTRLNKATTVSHSSLQSLGRTATGLSKTVSGAARASISEIGSGISGLAGTAAAALGPVGIAAAAIAAVVGAAGAASKALADAAVTRQRSAFSKGITPGQEASFGVYAQQFMGADALQAAANNQTSFGSAGQLAMLGIDFNKARSMTASDLAYKKLQGALSAAQASPDIPLENIPAVQAYLGLGGQIGDVRNALKLGPAALAESQAEQARNAGRLNITTGSVKNAATLKKAVEGAGVAEQSFGINKLTGADPAFAALLGAATGDRGAQAQVGAALQNVGTTIQKAIVPALHALKTAASSAATVLQGVAHSLTTPIAGTAEAAVVAAAKKAGVDPLLALAAAGHESDMNPRAKGDYGRFDKRGNFIPMREGASGGHYTSFGLFQLHESGELGNLTPAQAFNPSTNAAVALANFARVARAHPNWSPGQIAVTAQGADPAGGKYAADVNARYQKLVNQQRNTRPPTVSVKVSNPTQSRVAVSINAAALTSQF